MKTAKSYIRRWQASERQRLVPQRATVLGDLLFLATRGLMSSVRLRSVGADEVMACKRAGRPVFLVCWHGHDFLNLGGYHRVFGTGVRSVIMVRDNASGMVLHRFGQRMGIDVVTL